MTKPHAKPTEQEKKQQAKENAEEVSKQPPPRQSGTRPEDRGLDSGTVPGSAERAENMVALSGIDVQKKATEAEEQTSQQRALAEVREQRGLPADGSGDSGQQEEGKAPPPAKSRSSGQVAYEAYASYTEKRQPAKGWEALSAEEQESFEQAATAAGEHHFNDWAGRLGAQVQNLYGTPTTAKGTFEQIEQALDELRQRKLKQPDFIPAPKILGPDTKTS